MFTVVFRNFFELCGYVSSEIHVFLISSYFSNLLSLVFYKLLTASNIQAKNRVFLQVSIFSMQCDKIII